MIEQNKGVLMEGKFAKEFTDFLESINAENKEVVELFNEEENKWYTRGKFYTDIPQDKANQLWADYRAYNNIY